MMSSHVVRQGAYHGDTQGAMDAVPPSVFNGFKQAPWCALGPDFVFMVWGPLCCAHGGVTRCI